MPTTINSALRYPISGDAPNVPQFIQNLATDVDTKMPRGHLCKPIALTGNLGTSGNGLAVGTTPTLTVPANRILTLAAAFQVFINASENANGAVMWLWFERWVGGSITKQFGGKTMRVTTSDLYDFTLTDDDQVTGAGDYVWKVAGAISTSATASVDTSIPTGTVVRSRGFSVKDTGPIPAV